MRRCNGVTRILDADRRAHGDEWWLAGNRRESVSPFASKREAKCVEKQLWRRRKRQEDEAREVGADPHDKRTWPRCAGCRVTLSLKHARRASRCVSCINRAGDYNTFRRRVHEIIHGK